MWPQTAHLQTADVHLPCTELFSVYQFTSSLQFIHHVMLPEAALQDDAGSTVQRLFMR